MSAKRLRRIVGFLRSGWHALGERSDGDGTERRIAVDELTADVAEQLSRSDDVVLRESLGLFLRRNVARGRGASDVELDEDTDTVLVSDGSIRIRDDVFPVDGWNWHRYYSSVSVAGIYFLLLCRLGGPTARLLDATSVLLVTSVLLFVGSICQRYFSRERTLV
ncbi:hypothetical protein ACFQE1_07885 [Halobium palmae]|uniref:Uncharacterized protein n=1 Tax=Halobium palmae TaxID=1776492 RepID=A0ABD5RYH6_9EURY